jgi:hypothetical protein
VEINQRLNVTVAIVDDLTPPANMRIEWSAAGGSFVGTGQQVQWQAPNDDKTPTFYTITVKVTESYTGPNGPAEHVVTASTGRITVNNSNKEIADIGGQFIVDFSDSNNNPQYVCRNFSQRLCGPGYRAEISDVTNNRQRYRITGSTWNVTSIVKDYNAGRALLTIRARFVSVIRQTNAQEIAVGDSLLHMVYDTDRWLLCESRWAPASTASIGFLQ